MGPRSALTKTYKQGEVRLGVQGNYKYEILVRMVNPGPRV